MQNKDKILEIYLANKVEGRSEFCPRKGTYKIISVYKGTCLNKPATMATAYWKLETQDAFTAQIFTIQLESFKTTLQPLNTENIIGREIEITDATWFPKLLFALSWKLLPSGRIDLEQINRFLNENSISVNLDDFQSVPSVFIEQGKEGEYDNL